MINWQAQHITMVKVAIKFCGGCNPEYDRVGMFERIRKAAANRIEWHPMDDGETDTALFICGCSKACPAEKPQRAVKLILVKDDGVPPERIVDKLLMESDGSI